MVARAAGLIAMSVLAACSRTPPSITSCGDSLTGVWRGPSGDWDVIDTGAKLEMYPLFADAQPSPRMIALRRSGAELTGEVNRRYMLGDAVCIATAAVHVLSCSTQTLELTLADPAAPASYVPCTFSTRSNPSRHEKWQRAF